MSGKEDQKELMEQFSRAITGHFDEHLEVFSLNEPLMVTVTKPNGEYRKKSLIGGEEFTANSAYVGKKGNLIFVFSPNDPSDFKTMELSEIEARRSLTPFDRYLSDAIEGPIGESLRELRAKQETDRITQQVQQGTAIYGDQFGDF